MPYHLANPLLNNYMSNYCSLPFRGMQLDNNGEIKVCCVYKPDHLGFHQRYKLSEFDSWWSQGIEHLRDTVRQDRVDPGCGSCFSGSTSHPLRERTSQLFRSTQPIQSPDWLEIRFGSTCNLKCIMCTPHASSQIRQEYHSHRDLYLKHTNNYDSASDYQWWKNPSDLAKIKQIAANAKHINFSGGEPLMAPVFLEILDCLDSDCVVTINTNFTKVDDKFFAAAKRFPRLSVSVSLDGTGAHQEYIRYGCSWSELDQNLRKGKQQFGGRLTASYLLQHTSVFAWPALWEYLQSLSIVVDVLPVFDRTIDQHGAIGLNSVSPRDWDNFLLTHSNLPTPHDQTINSWIATRQFDQQAYQNFQGYVGMLDKIRGTSFRAVFNPSWW